MALNKKAVPKKLPYGSSDFERIRKENYYYVDKTIFIKEIEEVSSDYLFFIRPRRFGKSLWLSLMECYYDIKRKDSFQEIFKGTSIYDNPTEERNSYFVLRFNFSEVSSDISEVETSFNNVIKLSIIEFFEYYKSMLTDFNTDLYNSMLKETGASLLMSYTLRLLKGKGRIYLLIDEYDNFTNTIISSSGQEKYRAITHGEGFYRHFFNVIKSGTTGPGAPLSKLFITGVSPVTMDDVTSGFNIGYNITNLPAFNEMVGFTKEEVLEILSYYREQNLIKEKPENFMEIMKVWYNNYLFSDDKNIKMYNSNMTLYFINEYINRNKLPKDMLDQNMKTDYKKLKYLVLTDFQGRLRVNGNFEKLKIILQEGEIRSNLTTSFPAERIIDPENFISLFYYLGLLTIKGTEFGMTVLSIPNETIKQLYYEYIREGYRDTDIFSIDLFKLIGLFTNMTYKGEWENLILYLSEEMSKQTALRDYIEGEKSVQTFLRVYLNVSNYYITKSESEANRGFCDILLIPRLHSFPDIPYSYMFEIKYIKKKDFTKKMLQKKIEEARGELDKYSKDPALLKMIEATKLQKIILVFCGVELKHRELYEGEDFLT